jgi:hypothetical protein
VSGYIRISSEIRNLISLTGSFDYDDEGATIRASGITLSDDSGQDWSFDIHSPHEAAQIQIAHALNPPRHWLYWRNLVNAIPSDGSPPMHGWLESSRFGA